MMGLDDEDSGGLRAAAVSSGVKSEFSFNYSKGDESQKMMINTSHE